MVRKRNMAPIKRRALLKRYMKLLALIQGAPTFSHEEDRKLRVRIAREAGRVLGYSEVEEVEVTSEGNGLAEGIEFDHTVTISAGKDMSGVVWVGIDNLYTVTQAPDEDSSEAEDVPDYGTN